jgi:hypothetical protein
MTDPMPIDKEPDAAGAAGRRPSMPRWVKVSLVILAVLAAILVAGLVTGGHGPSRHGGGDLVELAIRGGTGTQ